MTTLFNRDRNGAEELQALTGTFAASNDYDSISGEIAEATRELAGLVGMAVIEKASDIYSQAPTEHSSDAALLRAVRLPVAVLAVSRYSQLTMVSHEDSGRKVKADGNDHLPWEWMIDRDDRAHLEKYYRSLDALYSFLEENAVPEWMTSEQRGRFTSSIVRTLNQFEAAYPVDHSYYVYYMLQSLVLEKQPRLRKMLGDELWSAVVSDSSDKVWLCALCRRWVILNAVVTAVRRWSLTVFPLSIARRFSPSYQGNKESRVATFAEMNEAIAALNAQAEECALEIAEEIEGENPSATASPLPKNDRRNKFFTAQ